MDKYEAFKKFLYKNHVEISAFHMGTSSFTGSMETTEKLLEVFEHHYKEAQKEEEIKKILNRYLFKVEINNEIINKSDVDDCYNELKDGGYLKWTN